LGGGGEAVLEFRGLGDETGDGFTEALGLRRHSGFRGRFGHAALRLDLALSLQVVVEHDADEDQADDETDATLDGDRRVGGATPLGERKHGAEQADHGDGAGREFADDAEFGRYPMGDEREENHQKGTDQAGFGGEGDAVGVGGGVGWHRCRGGLLGLVNVLPPPCYGRSTLRGNCNRFSRSSCDFRCSDWSNPTSERDWYGSAIRLAGAGQEPADFPHRRAIPGRRHWGDRNRL
jgi:hypothetical protein